MMTIRTGSPSDLRVLDETAAAALLDPERRRLVEALGERPDSAAGLARRLGEKRQRLNYHMRTLEEAGVLELAEENRRGNCTERVLRVSARRFVVDPSVLGGLSVEAAPAGDRFSATWLIGLAARAIRELAGLRDRAERQRKRLATAAIESEVRLRRPADFETFIEDLAGALAEVVSRHHAGEEGRPFRVVLGSYPAPTGERAPQHGGER